MIAPGPALMSADRVLAKKPASPAVWILALVVVKIVVLVPAKIAALVPVQIIAVPIAEAAARRPAAMSRPIFATLRSMDMPAESAKLGYLSMVRK